MSDPVFRQYSDEDVPALLSLFSSAFKKTRTLDQWRWKYFDRASGSIALVAEMDGRIIGHYAILPFTLRMGQSNVMAGNVVDGMTHPNLGPPGIAIRLALTAFPVAEKSNLSLLIAFSNEAAIAGHRRVGWIEVGLLRRFVRPLRASWLLKRILKGVSIPEPLGRTCDRVLAIISRATSGANAGKCRISWHTVEGFVALGPEIEAFVHKALNPYKIVNVRSVDWLKWRLSEPGGSYSVVVIRGADGGIKGLAVLQIRTTATGIKEGLILDLLVSDSDARIVKMLLREAVRKSVSEDCDLCMILRNPSSPRTIPALCSLMVPDSKRIRFISRPIGDGKLPDFYRDLSNWYIDFIDPDE